ncbi:MAG: cytochrome c maturation protein CcmE [Actinomycetota bacterium]
MTDVLVDDGSLTPQEPRPTRRGRRRIVPALVAVGMATAVVALIWNLLGGALFFYNADEAVERRAELGDERFTLQGAPVDCGIVNGFQGDQPVVAFSITFGGADIDVVHFGDPAELFEPGVPVVLDGNWVQGDPGISGFEGLANDGYYFASDRMRVKHDNDYINEDGYDERLTESTEQATAEACS